MMKGAEFVQKINIVQDADAVCCAGGLNGRIEKVLVPGANDFGLPGDRSCNDLIVIRIARPHGRRRNRTYDRGADLDGLDVTQDFRVVESVKRTDPGILQDASKFDQQRRGRDQSVRLLGQ